MSELDERVITFLQDVPGAMGLTLDVATEETDDEQEDQGNNRYNMQQ